jgi:hypothetical protein
MYLTQFVARNIREIYLAMNVIQVYGIRIGFLMASVPLFMLLYFVATADGLTERYITFVALVPVGSRRTFTSWAGCPS